MELLSKLLKEMVSIEASDLFLSTGSPPAFRDNGELESHSMEPLASAMIDKMAQLIMRQEHIEAFENDPQTEAMDEEPLEDSTSDTKRSV